MVCGMWGACAAYHFPAMACAQELARLYTAEIVLAIVHLHKLGFVHRDLKPVRMWTAGWFELSCAPCSQAC